MTHTKLANFTGLSEFAAGHNDCCGPCAEEVALAVVEKRAPSATHMNAIRTRGIAEGWFKPKAGESVEGVYNDVLKYQRMQAELIAYGSSQTSIRQKSIDAILSGNPVVLNLTTAHAVRHVEPSVNGHFVTLGGYDTSSDSFLVANGDYYLGPARGVIVLGSTPTYWVPWSELSQGGANGAVILKASTAKSVPTKWEGMTSAQQMWPWLLPLNSTHISQQWNGTTELGIDIETPQGTPITSLTYGTVINSFYFGGGGVVVVKSQLAGIGIAAVYYQHLDLNVVQIGDVVRVGDLIGYSGGQLKGGHHPATCCSTGPHTEVGINGGAATSSWKGLGANRNPLPWLTALVVNGPPTWDLIASNKAPITNGPASSYLTALSDSVQGQGPTADSFVGMCIGIDAAMEWINPIAPDDVNFSPWPWDWQKDTATYGQSIGAAIGHDAGALLLRGLFIMLGFTIILAFLFHLAFGTEQGRLVTGAVVGGAVDAYAAQNAATSTASTTVGVP